jgi:hypothetical protein
MTDHTLQELRAFWEQTRSTNFTLYERYYGGDHPWENVVSKSMREQVDGDNQQEFFRFWKPANMAYVVVEEAVGYWAKAEITATVSSGGKHDRDKSELLTAQLRALFYNQREDVARAQALYGEGILRVRTPGDRPGKLVSYGLSPYQAGPSCMTFCEDPDEPSRVTQAVYLFIQGTHLWAQHMTAEKIDLYRMAQIATPAYGHTVAMAGLGGAEFLSSGKAIKTTPNIWGVVPIYSFFNGPGASDLFPMLNAQDSLNKAIYNLEAAGEYHGFPLLEVRGYAGRLENGVPVDLDVGPGSYVLVDEEGGIDRLDAADLGDLLAAEARGYLRVAQQGRSPSVLMEYSGLGDSGRVPSFLLEPLKMRLASKKGGAIKALELLARDLPRYKMEGAIDLAPYDLEIEIEMPLPSDEIGKSEARAREVQAGAMTRQQAARERGEDPAQFMDEWKAELELKNEVTESIKALHAPKPKSPIIK